MSNSSISASFKGLTNKLNTVQKSSFWFDDDDAPVHSWVHDLDRGQWFFNETMLDFFERQIRSAPYAASQIDGSHVRPSPAYRRKVLEYFSHFVDCGLLWSIRDGVVSFGQED
jgi:hypothetical protein